MLFSNNIKRLVIRKIKCSKVISIRSMSVTGDEKSASPESHKGSYDVIIAGGGMVGCTLACAFGKDSILSNLNVLLLEGGSCNNFELKSGFSNRVVALNQNTKSLMNTLKIWRHVEAMRLQPVRYMQVWDACSDAMIAFSSSEMMDDDVAYIVENDVLLNAVNTELTALTNNKITVQYNAKISGYKLPQAEEANPTSTVTMNNGDTYTCKLLIGADGANSAVRNAMGVNYLNWSYNQMGVVATLELAEECENSTAWQRWLPSGPVALLPLDKKHSSLVWSTWQHSAKDLLKMSEDQFVDTLNDALWKQYPKSDAVETCTSWLNKCLKQVGLPDGAQRQLPPSISAIQPGSRAAFPLGFGHSTRYAAPGVVLIGDAAHRVHPLAGQGVNLGFGDIKDLTDLLATSLYTGLDIAHPAWMEKYESSRQRHNVPTQLMIEMLHRLYSVDLMPVVLARSIGLQLTNALQPLKKMIMSHATT